MLFSLLKITVSCSYHIFNATSWDPLCCSYYYIVYCFSLCYLPCQAHHTFVVVSPSPRLIIYSSKVGEKVYCMLDGRYFHNI